MQSQMQDSNQPDVYSITLLINYIYHMHDSKTLKLLQPAFRPRRALAAERIDLCLSVALDCMFLSADLSRECTAKRLLPFLSKQVPDV